MMKPRTAALLFLACATALILGIVLASAAQAQSVAQGGTVTGGHPARWITSGVIGDGGTASSSSITSLGTTTNTGPGYCANSAASGSARQQLCLTSNTATGGKISLANSGGAVASPLQFTVNAIDSLKIGADGGLMASAAVTGGSKGLGTVNATAYYVDGVAAGGGSVTSATIAAGTGIAVSGTCVITSTGTCTVGLATIAANRVLGNVTAGTAAPIALTPTQLTTLVNAFTTSLSGAAPASGGGTSNFLRADGTWTAPSGSGAVNAGTAGQMAYYATSTNAVSGNANANISNGALTLGVATSVLGQLKLSGSTSGTMIITPPVAAGTGTLTLPVATDTLVGKATTDTLTNKTYDTAGSGNSFSINGNAITGVSGTGATVAMNASPTFTTPVLGAATATSINGVTISSTTGTLTITSAKTFAVTGTLTLTGTDSTSFAFPATSGTVGVLNNAGTWSAAQTHSANLITTSASILVLGGGIRVPVTIKANADMPYTVVSSDYFVCVNLSPAASVSVLLPASPTAGDTYLVKDCSGTASASAILTVNGNGNNINGAATSTMTTAYQSAAFTYNATTKWMTN